MGGEILVPVKDMAAALTILREGLELKLEKIYPADDPRIAVLSGYGLRLRLDREAECSPPAIRLPIEKPSGFQAIAGLIVEFFDPDEVAELPPVCSEFVYAPVASSGQESWVTGRAGMLYRDLIPGRQGGRFIASHIRIPDGGPVPDNVHYHQIRFQIIFCVKGWVRLVYEDQGEPFLMDAGDCVLQPPEIRHRVLECSPGLEVVEIGCPAEHPTFLDHVMELPTGRLMPERLYGDQHYIFTKESSASWGERSDGSKARDLRFGWATSGLAGGQVVRASGVEQDLSHDGEFRFLFVLAGEAKLATGDGQTLELAVNDAATLATGERYQLIAPSLDFCFLDVTLPG